MNSILNKEPVKRAEKILKEFDPNLKVIILEDTATVTDLDLQDIQDSVSKINQAGKTQPDLF